MDSAIGWTLLSRDALRRAEMQLRDESEGVRDEVGFFNRLAKSETVLADAQKLAHDLANGPTFGNAMTKRMLEMEWAMSVESAVEAEAVAQALCMETEDFARAFRAFAAKQKPVFEGN